MPQQSAQLDDLRERVRRAPNDGRAWLALARLLASAAPGPELNHAVEQTLRSLPESGAAWRLASEVFARQRGAEAALEWLEAAARQNPTLAAPLLALGDRRREAQDWNGAVDAYRAAQHLRPQDAGLLNNLGSCLASLWDFESARACFEAALQEQPGFAEARLNLAMLQAAQFRPAEALRGLDSILGENALAGETRESARILGAILREQLRLREHIEQATDSGTVDALQRALDRAPAQLCASDPRSLYHLDRLAAACGRVATDAVFLARQDNVVSLALAEAWTQCRQPDAGLAALVSDLAVTGTGVPAGPGAIGQEMRPVLGAIEARAAQDISLLSSAQGEAWLRYWHARLLAATPDRLPGQFKAAPNAVGGRYVTPPDAVIGTVRHLLQQLRPTVPAGLPRALFMYAAIAGIHPFGDGNGRLARFLLAWEMESGGLPALVIPMSLRGKAADALNLAWTDADLVPMLDSLQASREATARLLRGSSAS